MKKTNDALSAQRLRECLNYNPETGVFTYRIARHYLQAVGAVAGSAHGGGYLRIRIDGGMYFAHRLAWLFVHGAWPTHYIDHIDGNPANNSISNLRECTQALNLRNKRRQSNNKSGFKGVCWHKGAKKWVAQIGGEGGGRYLGLFERPEDAHAAYCSAAHQLHGEFARVA